MRRLTQGTRLPPRVVSSIMVGALLGLHAAHEATNEHGSISASCTATCRRRTSWSAPTAWRASPISAWPRRRRVCTPRAAGHVKGKISYMAPEQLLQEEIDRRTDLYGASIVMWEALVGRRMFPLGDIGSAVARLLQNVPPDPPSLHAPGIPPALDALVLRGLSRKRDDRFASAREMAQALELAMPPAGALEVGAAVEVWARESLEQRSETAALRHASSPPELAVRLSRVAFRRDDAPRKHSHDTRLVASQRGNRIVVDPWRNAGDHPNAIQGGLGRGGGSFGGRCARRTGIWLAWKLGDEPNCHRSVGCCWGCRRGGYARGCARDCEPSSLPTCLSRVRR